MTARAIGVFALVLAMASPAMAGPANSVIGAKKLQEDMVHSGGVGYPSIMYEWWNKGKGKMDWGLSGELVYGPWLAADTDFNNRFIKIGLGIDGMLRWNLISNKKPKVQNDFALLFKPGILISQSTGNNFTFGIKGEVGLPFTIDVHERVTVVTGGFLPIGGYIQNNNGPNFGEIPILIRMGVEINASDNVAPWFYFDLGPGIKFGDITGAGFAWRIGAGTAFWGVLGKNKNKSDSAAAEPMAE
ncbi:MAG: hypothetical protein WAU39_01785 [Polyangiales bacterium]